MTNCFLLLLLFLASRAVMANDQGLWDQMGQMAQTLPREQVERYERVFRQSSGASFESMEAFKMAATLARWYSLRDESKPTRYFLELALQMVRYHSLKGSQRQAEIDSIVPNLQQMYEELLLRQENGDTCANTRNHGDGDVCNPIDWTDSIFLRVGWDNDPIVVESHKLLFFHVSKNASTEFLQLFRRMMGQDSWKSRAVDDVHNPQTNGLKYLGDYSRQQQEEFLTSPDWTRAIFVRDPLQRLVSAYRDKALGGTQEKEVHVQPAGRYFKEKCCGMNPLSPNGNPHKPHCARLRPYELPTTPGILPFRYFVQHFLKSCPDQHWRPQSQRMSEASWRWINFVGNLEHLTEDAHALLHKIGAFQDFGSTGWGAGAFLERNLAEHSTNSKEKWKQYFSSLQPAEEGLVLDHYKDDYAHPVMNLTEPGFLDDTIWSYDTIWKQLLKEQEQA